MSTLTVSLVQYDIAWLSPEQNFSIIDQLIAAPTGCDLLLLPETFATGFALQQATAEQAALALSFMQQLAARLQCVVAGSVLVPNGDKKANRFYWVWPDGSQQAYDKRHLFCLGNEGQYVTQGSERKIFEINGFKLLPQVCYDLRFPVFQRSKNDYDVMVNVANWPSARRFAWDTLLRARAIENQCFVLATNRIGPDGNGIAHNGGTIALDYLGQTIEQVNDDQMGVVTVTLDKSQLAKYKSQFPAHLDADGFEITL
ncbi:nitrilase-related carbon-nitrogen hydrolase [Pseudoalteromonas obscura]|uniref:Nitrilase-related carbon-nitrogen hydrolase n=1 Tax=Pseudoalteromonas obscura TaxID=3048491 RepID=A0ABT7ET68_9GAMM|nr:nitrilase-related carbon-nitrogen hydrolase [Pseudoalteromonas sp. P94(2023)]MDK2598254.1 nitrilase-related carbon-nitrogen hydrolase [Pseudoalteromonas sp. P94(2023)]